MDDGMRRTIVSHTLYSAQLHEERTIKVFLPPHYQEASSYPVLYTQDGAEFFTYGRMATIAQQLIESGELPPVLIAGIAVKRSKRTEDYAILGARNTDYKQFVLTECLPFIEQHYRIQSSHRALAGISLGASVSLQLYLQEPALFSQLLLFSGAYEEQVQSTVDNETELSKLSAWLLAGTEETAVITPSGTHNFLAVNRKLVQTLVQKNASIAYSEADGTHTWGFWQRHTPDALRWWGKQISLLP